MSSATRHNLKILPGAIICEEAKLRGDITVGSHTIIHPSAYINAEAGPIIIGDRCLIEEQAKIIHRIPFHKEEKDTVPVLIIGSNNVFEVDCHVEAAKIGDHNVFESKCYVGYNVNVTNGCSIGAGCHLNEQQTLNENTIIYGSDCTRREGIDKPTPQTLQMESLTKMLFNYHHLRKPNKKN